MLRDSCQPDIPHVDLIPQVRALERCPDARVAEHRSQCGTVVAMLEPPSRRSHQARLLPSVDGPTSADRRRRRGSDAWNPLGTPSEATRGPRRPLLTTQSVSPPRNTQDGLFRFQALSVGLARQTGGEGGIRTHGTLAGTTVFEFGSSHPGRCRQVTPCNGCNELRDLRCRLVPGNDPCC